MYNFPPSVAWPPVSAVPPPRPPGWALQALRIGLALLTLVSAGLAVKRILPARKG